MKLFSINHFWSPETQQCCQKYPILIDIDTEYICNSEFLESMHQHQLHFFALLSEGELTHVPL